VTTARATTIDPFVVRPDRPRIRRLMVMQGVVAGVVVVLGVARVLMSEGWGRTASAVLYAVWLASIVWSLVVSRRYLAADVLVQVGPHGIDIDTLGRRGRVSLAWEAVASVRKDLWGRVVVRPTEGRKLSIAVQSSDAAANQILSAVSHFSGGRL
jgi:hypothetical protein